MENNTEASSFYRQVGQFIKAADYEQSYQSLVQMHKCDTNQKYMQQYYVLSLLLKNLINEEVELEPISLVNNQQDKEAYIANEYYLAAIRNVECENYIGAINNIEKSNEHCKKKRYINLLMMMLLDINIKIRKDSIYNMAAVVKSELKQNSKTNHEKLQTLISNNDYLTALQMIDDLIDCDKKIKVKENETNQQLKNMIEEVVTFCDCYSNSIATRYTILHEYDFPLHFLVERYLQEKNFNKALTFMSVLIAKKYHPMFKEYPNLLKRLEDIKLRNASLVPLVSENYQYLPSVLFKAIENNLGIEEILAYVDLLGEEIYSKSLVYLEIAKRSYIIGRVDCGDYFYELVDPTKIKSFKQNIEVNVLRDEVRLTREKIKAANS